MSIIEQKINALTAFVLADDEISKKTARKALENVMRIKEDSITVTSDQEDAVHQFLMEIGANPALLGYRYIAYGIIQLALDPNLIDNITYRFYPKIALEFDSTASRVDRAIRNTIDKIWERGDMDILIKYFGNTLSPMTDRPSNGHFLARSALIIRSRLKK
jgi:two-component system response regulator (stage 0 sporulation protein A)